MIPYKKKEGENKEKLKSDEEIFKELLSHFKKGGSKDNNPSTNVNILEDILMMDEEKFRQKREELLAKEKILTMKKIYVL